MRIMRTMRIAKIIRRSFTHDVGLKIAALVLALFVWINIAERKPVEVTADLPLKYTNMPAQTTFSSAVPTSVKVRILGRGRFVHWRLKDAHLAIDLSGAERGVVTHVVSPAEAVLPEERGLDVLEVIEPKAIRIELDVLVTRGIPIRPVLQGNLMPDKIMLGAARPDPVKAVIAGSKRVLEELSSVPTAPIDINQLAKRGKVSAKLDLAGLPPLASQVDDVTVSARIEPRKELGIPAVPIEAARDGGVRARFTPEAVDVVISGAASQVDSLDPRDVRLVVDIAGLVGGQAVLNPVVSKGSLHFEARQLIGGRRDNECLDLAARLSTPFGLEIVSITPDEVGLVLR